MTAATAESANRLSVVESLPTPNGQALVQAQNQATSTALTKINSGSAILSLAEKSGNPMQFLTDMGKQMAFSGMLGLKKPEQGSTLLLICITENKTPLSVIQEYHLMDDGKMTKKADWVLSRFVEIGGKYKIIKNGSDNQEATYEFSYGINAEVVSYSMEDAQREELVKPKSRWVKNPASMLRARVITNGVRMVAPQVFAGFNTVEELEGQEDTPSPPVTRTRTTTVNNTVSKPQPARQSSSETIIDAEVEAKDESSGDSQVPLEGGTPTTADSARTAMLMEITLIVESFGLTMVDVLANFKKKFPEVNTLNDVSDERLAGALGNLRAKKSAVDKAKIDAAGSGAVGE